MGTNDNGIPQSEVAVQRSPWKRSQARPAHPLPAPASVAFVPFVALATEGRRGCGGEGGVKGWGRGEGEPAVRVRARVMRLQAEAPASVLTFTDSSYSVSGRRPGSN